MGKALEKTVIEIEGTLKQLRSQYSEWSKQNKLTHKMLYDLLDGCYEFYRLLKKDEELVQAFRELVGFKMRNNTKISVIVLKQVFGDEIKTVYAYSKSMEEAFKNNVGNDGKSTLSDWLRESHGIDGSIRNQKKQSRAEIERLHAINVARNPKDYGIVEKNNVFTSESIIKEYKQYDDIVLLCKQDIKTGKLLIKWVSVEEKDIDHLYAQMGRFIMEQKNYKDNRVEASKKQQQRKNAAQQKVKDGLNKIVSIVSNVSVDKKAA